MPEVIVFLLAILTLAFLFRRDLLAPHTHGFYRFFAFSGILALVTLNASAWFRAPFSPLQIASWVFLSASLLLALHGFTLLRTHGRPRGPIENTRDLVRVGIYRYIRHPLYASLILFSLGAYLKEPSSTSTGLLLGIIALLIQTARVEEGENLARFGESYRKYMAESKRFLPYLF